MYTTYAKSDLLWNHTKQWLPWFFWIS